MSVSPEFNAKGVLRVSLFSSGSTLSDAIAWTSLHVERGFHRTACATLELLGGDRPEQVFLLSDTAHFLPGARLQIKAGYGDDEDTLFDGLVIRHCAEVVGDSDVRLVVQAQELQDPEQDLLAHAPDTAAALTVCYGNDLYAFRAEMDACHRCGAVQDPSRISGHMHFQGNAKAQVGGVIDLVGVGARFSGKVAISSLQHRIKADSWVTEARFGETLQCSVCNSALDGLGATNGSTIFSNPGQHRIAINEADHSITITTPGNKQVVLRENATSILLQDQNNNRVELSPSGISLSSAGKITLDAKGNVGLQSVDKPYLQSTPVMMD